MKTDSQSVTPSIPVSAPAVESAYLSLKKTVIRNFGECSWFNVETCLSVVATLMLKDLINPVGLLLINSPSSGKTTVLSMFYDLSVVYRSDNFTPASIVSHANNVRNEDKLKKIDLLPRIKHKCLIIKDMASVLGQDKDQLQKSLGMLTNIFDGEGYKSDSGSHGQRGYTGDYLFALLAATPPIPGRIWKMMSTLGSRLLFLTADECQSPEERIAQSFSDVFDAQNKPYVERVAECRDANYKYFQSLTDTHCKETFSRSIKWTQDQDCKSVLHKINLLADFAARARSGVIIKQARLNSLSDFEDFSQPLIEKPQRLASLLYAISRGHAIICGRKQVTQADLSVVMEVALSSMHHNRRQAIDLMLQSESNGKRTPCGSVSSTEIETMLTMSRPTAIKVLRELELLGLGSSSRMLSNSPIVFTLHGNYSWLLSEEFKVLRRPWEQHTK